MKIYGRYELVDPECNHNKFWHIIYDFGTKQTYATWGRIGSEDVLESFKDINNISYSNFKIYQVDVGEKKIKEKIRKGYSKVKGYKEILGE